MLQRAVSNWGLSAFSPDAVSKDFDILQVYPRISFDDGNCEIHLLAEPSEDPTKWEGIPRGSQVHLLLVGAPVRSCEIAVSSLNLCASMQ
jgi:hypothetical protein